MPTSTPMATRQKRGLTATTLAAYHHFQCDLFLHSTYHSPFRRGSGASRHPELPELTKATLNRGNDWEATLFAWLDDNGLLLRVHGGFLDGSGIQEVIEVDERSHFFVAGLSFLPPAEAFRQRFIEHGREPVQFGVAKPDLLEIRKEGNAILWRVIDAKSSGNVKTSHHVQIYFYHICLEYLLGTTQYEPMGTSGVWIPSPNQRIGSPSLDGMRTITVSLLSLALDDFLFDKLPEILSKPRKKVEWHFNPLCRGCPFENECANWAEEEGKLGAMPDISLQDAANLRNILGLVRSKTAPPRLTDIEELDETLHSRIVMKELTRFHPSVVKKAKRILKLTDNPDERGVYSSPIVDAARTQRVQILGKRIYDMPSDEDITLVISLVLDPATEGIAAYCITTFTCIHVVGYRQPVSGFVDSLLDNLYQVVQHILDLNDILKVPPRTQCYMFSLAERTALQRFLINLALTADPEDDDHQESIRVCIGALCEGASLLATSFQPLILSGALLDFLGKRGERTSEHLKTCLRRLGLPTVGRSDEELRRRIESEVERLKKQGKRALDSNNPAEYEEDGPASRPEIGQLPRIAVLKKSIERLLALPVPGFWDLRNCHKIVVTNSRFQCPSDDDIYSTYISDKRDDLTTFLATRNVCLYEVLNETRDLITKCNLRTKDILVNQARVLSSEFMDICRQDHLRKLFFMQQFEVLSKLQTLWQDRIDGCVDAPRLIYQHTKKIPDNSYVHYFILLSGYIDLPSEKGKSFFGYILAEDTDVYADIPPEALFDDLSVFNLVFPLNNFTKFRWLKQHHIVRKKILVADVQDIQIRENRTMVTLRTSGQFDSFFKRDSIYRLSPRLVDFNITKTLSTLVEIDLQTPPVADYAVMPPFLQLFAQARSFAKQRSEWESVSEAFLRAEVQIQSLFKEVADLGSQAAAALLLKPSQRRALRRILGYRLSVIWGPPGTGKTYTVSLSLLRLLEVRYKCDMHDKQCIFLTAMTHAAIEACLAKIRILMQKYREIPGLNVSWMGSIILERIFSGGTHPISSDNKTHIYAGTVYQLYNFSKRSKIQADCVIIDEAGQLGLGPASLVLRSLKSSGRVIIAGDSEQLAPILTSQYPQAESRLFGSILDSLISLSDAAEDETDIFSDSPTATFSETSQVSTIVQLTENFRLNPDLGEFVSTIYKKSFKSQKSQTKNVAKQLSSLDAVLNTSAMQDQARNILVALSAAMLRRNQIVLRPPTVSKLRITPSAISAGIETLDIQNISLALVRLSVSSEHPDQFGYESHVRGEASFAAALVRLIQIAAPEETIFVATPHRIQRHAVKDALRTRVDGLTNAFENLQLDRESRDVGASSSSEGKVTVDTIERLQGSEAAFVICLFSHTHLATAPTAIDFLLERRRLNVAISRAKTLCILVTSQEVLKPSVRIFSNPNSAKGFAFLKAFENRAWTANVNVNLDEVNRG